MLAAGASKRLGQPKQLVSFKGKSLLQHVIDCTKPLNLTTKVLVVGANADELLKRMDNEGYHVCLNNQWEEGMGRSLASGLEESLHLEPDLDGLLVMIALP